MVELFDEKGNLHDIDMSDDKTGDCPDCGGDIRFEDSESVVCDHCGEHYTETKPT